MKRIVFLIAVFTALAGFAVDTNVVVMTREARVAPFSKDIVSGTPEGALKDRAGKIWPKLSAIAIRNGITNMDWIVETYCESLSSAMDELSASTNCLPQTGLCLGLRFPLDNTSERKALEGYVVDQHYDEDKGYDVLRVHFTKDLVEPQLALRYVSEASVATNSVAGAWRLPQQYPGSHWTNRTSVTWRNWTYDNVHTCYFKRPAGCQAMPLNVNPHLRWDLSGWGSAILHVDGKPTLTGNVYDTVNLRYATFKNGHRIEPLWTYAPVSAARLASMKAKPATANARAPRRFLGIENYK